jgi:serine/threonine protein kinase
MENIIERLQRMDLSASVMDRGCRCVFPKCFNVLVKSSCMHAALDAHTEPWITTIVQRQSTDPYFDVVDKDRISCRFYFDPGDGGFIVQNTSESRASVFLTSCLAKDTFKVEFGKFQMLQKNTWKLGTRFQSQVFVFRIIDPYTPQHNGKSVLQRRNPLTFGSSTPPGRYDLQAMCHLGGPDWNTLARKAGSNSVYVAYHSGLGDVVVKSMWTPALKPTDLVGKIYSWVRETSIHRTLYHVSQPHSYKNKPGCADRSQDCIIRYLGCDARILSIFVERADGPDLAAMRDDQGMWTGNENLGQAIWIDVLSSLVYLTQQGILHNDIKPSNIVWDMGKRRAKLCDFGLASKPDTNRGGGTPHYVAPEYWLRQPRTFASDMYSLGILVLYLFRYTKLPDLYGRWDIQQALTTATGTDYQAMSEWLDQIERIRTTIRNPEMSGMINVLPRERSSPETLLEHLKSVGVNLGDRSDASMAVSWAGFEGAPRMDHGSTTIPFTNPFDATEPFKAAAAIDTDIIVPQRLEHRVDKRSFSTLPRRSARIAAMQVDLGKGQQIDKRSGVYSDLEAR